GFLAMRSRTSRAVQRRCVAGMAIMRSAPRWADKRSSAIMERTTRRTVTISVRMVAQASTGNGRCERALPERSRLPGVVDGRVGPGHAEQRLVSTGFRALLESEADVCSRALKTFAFLPT